MSLKNKRVLITAGPTWVPIDSVRVISNIATGQTGILAAEALSRQGCYVTLLLGPVKAVLPKKIKLIHFKYFDELKETLEKELKNKRYDIVIHSAAVSDYRLKAPHPHHPSHLVGGKLPTYEVGRVGKMESAKEGYRGKIKSGLSSLKLNLIPTQKIINQIKGNCPSVFLAGFKFEPDADKKGLVNKARALLDNAGADLVVANTLSCGKYNAYIVTKNDVSNSISAKSKLVKALIKEIGDRLCRNQT